MIYEFKCPSCMQFLSTDTKKYPNCSRCGSKLNLIKSYGANIEQETQDSSPKAKKAKLKKLEQQSKDRVAAFIERHQANKAKQIPIVEPKPEPKTQPQKKIIKAVVGDTVIYEE